MKYLIRKHRVTYSKPQKIMDEINPLLFTEGNLQKIKNLSYYTDVDYYLLDITCEQSATLELMCDIKRYRYYINHMDDMEILEPVVSNASSLYELDMVVCNFFKNICEIMGKNINE